MNVVIVCKLKEQSIAEIQKNKNGKHIPCREMRVCNSFKRSYVVEGQ